MDNPMMNDNQGLSTEQEPLPTHILSNRDRDIFLALLDADEEPTEALKAAAAEFKKGWHEGDVYHFQLPARDTDAEDAQDKENESTPCAF